MTPLKPESLKFWLESLGCKNVTPVKVTIGEKTFDACRYDQILSYTAEMDCVRDGRHKAGETYTRDSIYCLGKIDNARKCFPFEGKDWYVCCYVKSDKIKPEFAQYHPFGANFILGAWDIPNSKIDDGELKPYERIPMTVKAS